MSKLQWPHLKDFMAAKRVPLYPSTGKAKKATGAFYQEYMNLRFFWILKAGHMVSKQAHVTFVSRGNFGSCVHVYL
jgi:serine carboxypeptidase 1